MRFGRVGGCIERDYVDIMNFFERRGRNGGGE